MRKLLFSLFNILAIASSAKVFYFTSDAVRVPEGEITAIEVRASNPTARAGQARLSGWAIEWDGSEIQLTFDFRDFVDGITPACAILSANNESVKIQKNINIAGGFNSAAIEWKPGGHAAILCGERKLSEYLQFENLPRPTDSVRVKSLGGDIVIQEVIIETNSNSFERLKTDYTAEELSGAPQWLYLDRVNDPTIAVIGGEYRLAQINNELIYIAGAKTNADSWQTGMLKGKLTPTGFSGYYKLEWIDATGRKMPGENFAEHDSSLGILNLTFPELDASIRLKLTNEQTR